MVEEKNHTEHRNMNDKSLGNLVHWKPGQSGNPGGRPKDPGITAIQIEMLDKKCPYDSKGRTWRDYLAERGLLLAIDKEGALEHLKERLEGKVADKIESDIPITIRYVRGKLDK